MLGRTKIQLIFLCWKTNYQLFLFCIVARYCIPNAVEDTTYDRVLRLNLHAHPLSYINDQDMGTTWQSKAMTAQELEEGVTVTVDLAHGLYQVMYLITYKQKYSNGKWSTQV